MAAFIRLLTRLSQFLILPDIGPLRQSDQVPGSASATKPGSAFPLWDGNGPSFLPGRIDPSHIRIFIVGLRPGVVYVQLPSQNNGVKGTMRWFGDLGKMPEVF